MGEESWRAWETTKKAFAAGGRLQKQLVCSGVKLGFYDFNFGPSGPLGFWVIWIFCLNNWANLGKNGSWTNGLLNNMGFEQ